MPKPTKPTKTKTVTGGEKDPDRFGDWSEKTVTIIKSPK